MKIDKRKASSAFLILGMTSLIIGISTDNISFSWAAIVFVLLSLILGGRWMRGRKR